jgi:predicted dithiol-disulfide oxidoreductase (DUF899 family)
MNTPPIVSPEEWEAARQQLLVKEKELTRARDKLAAERRRMPWLAVEKKYEFEGPDGKVSLLDLFEGRRQLIVYRAFLEPGVYGWPEHACIGCSMVADQVAHLAHLNARDTTLAFVSRAPQAEVQRVKARMGWVMPWYTMKDDFDADFGVDEWHGTNAFIRDGDRVFRTYFINARGDEAMGSTWSYLDLTALGRQEEWRNGRTRRRATRRPRRTSGGCGMTYHAGRIPIPDWCLDAPPVDCRAAEIAVAVDRLTRVRPEPVRPLRSDSKTDRVGQSSSSSQDPWARRARSPRRGNGCAPENAPIGAVRPRARAPALNPRCRSRPTPG